MKSVKNDTKYIIKRILIGVGIAIVLFNLKKCNVYADSNVRTFYNNANNITGTWTYSTESGNCASHNYNNSNDTFNYGGYEYNVCWYAPNNPGKKLLVAFEYHNDIYVMYYNLNVANPTSRIDFTLTSTQFYISSVDTNIHATPGYIPHFMESYYYNTGTSYSSEVYNLTKINVDHSIGRENIEQLKPEDLYLNDNYEDLHMIYNTYNLPVYINDSYVIPDYSGNVPSNYTEVDLTGYQAILIVPKNYPYLLSEYGFESGGSSANNPKIHYTIYYKKCIKPTLIEINDLTNFSINTTLNSDPTSEYDLNSYCSDIPLPYTQDYPIYNLRTDPSSYYYMGILVYNNSIDYSQNSPDWINTQQNPYGQSYVYVDTEFYNYYLVSDFSNFNQTLSYKDFNLEDKTTTINSLPTFDNLIGDSIDNVNENLIGQDMTYQNFVSFVKFPITFLRDLVGGTCSSLTFPLPRNMGNIVLPCMSTIYSEHLPSNLINLLSMLINGLLFLRVTLQNIACIQDVVSPEDTELEVWSL